MTKNRTQTAEIEPDECTSATRSSKTRTLPDLKNTERREKRWKSKAEATRAQVREVVSQLSQAESTVQDLHNTLNQKDDEVEAAEARQVSNFTVVTILLKSWYKYAPMESKYNQEVTGRHEQHRIESGKSLEDMHRRACEAMQHRLSQDIRERTEHEAKLAK
jgi:hypothetical protein